MNKKYQTFALAALIVIGALWFFINTPQKVEAPHTTDENLSIHSDPLNTTYLVESEAVQLVDGFSGKEIVPDSAVKDKWFVFGEPPLKDC